MSRRYTYFIALIGVICVYFIVRLLFFIDLSTRTVQSDVLQGVLIGAGLALATTQMYARIKATKVNGWITMFGLGVPGNGMFLRAAHALVFLGPVVVPQEAMYWWTNSDGAGHALDGQQNYIMHFPPGGLPPNNAFWSLTMGDAKINLCQIRSSATMWAIAPALCRMPMAQLMFICRAPLRQVTSRTGFQRLGQFHTLVSRVHARRGDS